jgi:hypothetical protein
MISVDEKKGIIFIPLEKLSSKIIYKPLFLVKKACFLKTLILNKF